MYVDIYAYVYIYIYIHSIHHLFTRRSNNDEANITNHKDLQMAGVCIHSAQVNDLHKTPMDINRATLDKIPSTAAVIKSCFLSS